MCVACTLDNVIKCSCIKVVHANDDADVLIIKQAIDLSESTNNVTIISVDTDILMLLLYHFEKFRSNLYLPVSSKKHGSNLRLVNIKYLHSCLGSNLSKILLYCHAFSGCDTTSSIYGFGKVRQWNKIKQSDLIHEHLIT